MSRKILVVEDNADNLKLFAWMLEDEGYDFEAAGTGEAGLEALALGGFGLVLMDISLPGMDGKEATRRIRSDPRLAGLPVIAVTAHAIKGEEQAILDSGVSALVTKPIDEALLLETIDELLGREVARG